MQSAFDQPPVRVEQMPSLGAALVTVTYPRVPAASDTSVEQQPATALVHTSATLDDVIIHLIYIQGELNGLRADLASRTFAARCRRVWNWIREGVNRYGFWSRR